MCLDLFAGKGPRCGSILVNDHPPVSDHAAFAFWVIAYGSFDCVG